MHLNDLSVTKNNIAIKSCDNFFVFHILSANSGEQFQNVANPVTLYSVEVPLKNCGRDFCLKPLIVISAYLMYIF